jgi:hypothetical protein
VWDNAERETEYFFIQDSFRIAETAKRFGKIEFVFRGGDGSPHGAN